MGRLLNLWARVEGAGTAEEIGQKCLAPSYVVYLPVFGGAGVGEGDFMWPWQL